MYRVWYWAMIDRENDGRFIASIPDLGDLAAYGHTDKDAVAHVTELAAERVRAAVDDGQPVPPRRQCSEMPSHIRSKEVGPRDDSGGSRAPRSVANSALSHVRLSPGARNGKPSAARSGAPVIEVRSGGIDIQVHRQTSGPQTPAPMLWPQPFGSLWRLAPFRAERWRMS